MRTAIVVQARMGSKRFPGKVLAPLAGKPVLAHVIERCLKIEAEELIVAVPHETPDELKDVARGYSVKVIEGPEDDVLGRYFIAANAYPIDIIMRITADCPLIEPSLCDKVLALYKAGGCGYAAIGEGRTFPKGYGCEVFSKFTLDLANQLATDPYDREHVTPWMERNVRCKYLTQPKDESHLNYCIDVPGDIERLERILDEPSMETGLDEIETCKGWCHEPAEVIFNYNTSQGHQRVHLCTNCARLWWNGAGKQRSGFKNTDAGLSLIIESV